MAESGILARIGLNSAGFKTGLAQCKAAAASFKASLSSIFSGIGWQIMGALGLGAGIAGIGMLARESIAAGSKISDMATHLRMGTTELQTLMEVSRAAGMDIGKMELGLKSLNERTAEAADGNDSYRDAFKRLGIDLRGFMSLPLEQKLSALANAYKSSGESLTALNDVSTLLGQKAAPEMLEVLDKVATEGMDKLAQSAIAAGDVMDEETIASMDRAADEIGRWQNRIMVAFAGFLSDMGSSIGRQQWGLMIGMKFAQAGEFIENAMRNISNYLLGTFSAVFRYINGQFADFIIPARNLFFEFISAVGGALSKFASLFSDSFAQAINESIESLGKLKDEVNDMAKKDKGKDFKDLFGEELYKAEEKNANRKRSDMLGSYSVDWYKEQLKPVEAARAEEKQSAIIAERTRKAKYAKADENFEIKESAGEKAARKKEINSAKGYNDSSLAKIGGGGLVAARYDVGEKQLSETKRQSKLLEKIAENTESRTKTELLMK